MATDERPSLLMDSAAAHDAVIKVARKWIESREGTHREAVIQGIYSAALTLALFCKNNGAQET